MADTLTQLIAKVQANLQDNGTLFTTATVTAAVRQALADLNRSAPLHLAKTITAVADQRDYELDELTALQITDVLLDGDNEYDVALAYYAYAQDARWFFRLSTPQIAGETLIVQYTAPHTINGLDSSLDSTLSDELNLAVIQGACFYSALSRAAAGVESNNIESEVTANWLKLANMWQRLFHVSLAPASHQPTARGEIAQVQQTAWNDAQHSESYP